MNMKKYLLAIASALLLWGCAEKETNKCINILAPDYSVESMTDCTVPVCFSSTDIDWAEGKLSMEVFVKDIYDAKEIDQMQIGDTIMFEGSPIVVKTINKVESNIEVNGGIEQEEGVFLVPYEEGKYRSMVFSDHFTFVNLGKVEVPISKDLYLADCGLNPTDPIDTIRTDIQQYLDTVPDYRKEFSVLNTEVVIKDGEVKSISRRWIP